MASQYTMEYLKELQGYPLEIKLQLTKQRIREWVHRWGVDGVYIAFSGGKDSTVLLDIARQEYPDILAVFINTGLEFPEIVKFVKQFENVEIIKPNMNFKQVIQKYGYPFVSKEVSGTVGGGWRALKLLEAEGLDTSDRSVVVEQCRNRLKKERGEWRRLAQCVGAITKDNVVKETLAEEEKGQYSDIPQKYKYLLSAPFPISDRCCYVMKKNPAHKYMKETGRVQITAQLAEESRLRRTVWLRHGCNAFDTKHPTSNPMSFWTNQDVLKYIKDNNLAIAPVYGDVVYLDEDGMQYDMAIGNNMKLTTTGMKRTGCMFCGYGCHLEPNGDGRFEKMKATHPKIYDYIMRPWEDGGLNYKEVIDWINEHGDLHIRY